MKRDDTPAFPTMGNPECDHYIQGMTLRDYMAGQALPAIMRSVNMGDMTVYMPDYVASEAYKIADAMMKARGE